MKSDRFFTLGASTYILSLDADTAFLKLNTDAYGASYRALLKLAAGITDDEKHDAAHALACAAYGWMPTIIKSFEPERFGTAAFVQNIKKVSSFGHAVALVKGIDDVAPINRSWVGTSKFLHFLNPEVFPIWDSRVAMSFYLGRSPLKIMEGEGPPNMSASQLHQFCNKKNRYLRYIKFMALIVKYNLDWTSTIQKEIKSIHGYNPSKLRCIELMLFSRYIL